MKNILFEQKKLNLIINGTFLENKTEILQHV